MDSRDIKYNLLLQSNIDDLLGFCLTDRVSNQICNSRVFWDNKYSKFPMLKYRDNLMLNIEEYKYAKSCWDRAEILLMEAYDRFDIMHVTVNSPNDFDVFPKEIQNILLNKFLPLFSMKVRDPTFHIHEYEPHIIVGVTTDIDENGIYLQEDLDEQGEDADPRVILNYEETVMMLYKCIYNNISVEIPLN
jgi:hypothetical protein